LDSFKVIRGATRGQAALPDSETNSLYRMQNLGLFLLYPKTVWRPRSVVLDASGCDPVMPLPKVVLMGQPDALAVEYSGYQNTRLIMIAAVQE